MVKIGLDISQNSSGICINWGEDIEFISFINTDKLNKQQNELLAYIDIQIYQKNKLNDNHSSNQKINLMDYINLSIMISNYLYHKLKNSDNIIFSFEDYSMGSSFKNNYLIQLVTLTTLIRAELIKMFPDSIFIFTPPTKIKKDVACMVYGKNEKDECRNDNGVAGGKFNKHDMVNAFIKYNKDIRIKDYIKANDYNIMKNKKIISPIPDVIDAYWIQEFLISV